MTRKRTAKPLEVADELVVEPRRPVAVRLGRIPLRSLDELSVEMARVYRDARRSRIATDDASRLVYTLGQLRMVLEAIRDSEYIERIIALEARAGINQGDSNVIRLANAPKALGGSNASR